MRTLILTNCTNRKRAPGVGVAQFRDIHPAPLTDVMTQWAKRLAGVGARAPARDVYCGRSFTEAVSAANFSRAELRIVSAGLGLVAASTEIPNYSATISPGAEDSILAKMDEINASAWWDALVQDGPFSSPADLDQFDRIWIALSSPYLEMVKHTLVDWVAGGFQGLRIFCKPAVLPKTLAPYALPYDERLNDPRGPIPGTEGDFAQRALAHFSKISIDNPLTNLEEDFVTVQASLFGLVAPKKPNRQVKSDPEIRSIIRTEAQSIGWNSSKMLRHLRDELDVACEQKRFQKLFKSEMSGESAA